MRAAGIGLTSHILNTGSLLHAHASTREIGIRMSLGAARYDLLQLLLGWALSMVPLGVITGIVGSVAIARVLSGFLFGIKPTDPIANHFIAANEREDIRVPPKTRMNPWQRGRRPAGHLVARPMREIPTQNYAHCDCEQPP